MKLTPGRIRIELLNLIERILLGIWRNPISKIIESIHISIPNIILKENKIRDSCITRYNYPKEFATFFRKERYFPDRYVFMLKNIIFLDRIGVAITEDRKILAESYGSIRRILLWGDIRHKLFSRVKTLNQTKPCYFIGISGFYHFILEELPALIYAIDSFGELIFYSGSETYQEYFNSSLEFILGAEYSKIINPISGNYKFEKVVITQRDPFSGGVHPSDIHKLNQSILPKINLNNSIPRIYISRKNNNKRKIHNEDKIESLMTTFGFRIVYLEDHLLKDQIEMVQGAEIIASPHGAGLSHIVWNPDNHKKIIEIFPSYTRNDCYAGIALSLGYDYDYTICTRAGEMEICDLSYLESKLLNFEDQVR